MDAIRELKNAINADPDRRARVDELKLHIERELRLQDLRTAKSITQVDIAEVLGISQARVSKLESQSDAKLSTISAYVEALGGDLEVTAVFGSERIPLQRS